MQETITIVGDTVYSLLSALSLESKSDSDGESGEMSMKIGKTGERMKLLMLCRGRWAEVEAEIRPVKRKNYGRYHGDGDSIRAKPRQRPVSKKFLLFKPSKASTARITSCAKLQLVTGERERNLKMPS